MTCSYGALRSPEIAMPDPQWDTHGRLETLDLHVLLAQAISLTRGSLSGNISISGEFCRGSAMVRGSGAALRHAFLNLFINARDALPQGGRIAVRTRFQGRNDPVPGRGSDCLLISIRDNGMGIPKRVLPKIFEPYFTTKGPKGSGLGLTNARAAIEAHGGTITVDSAETQGTEFTVCLPLTAQDPDSSPLVSLGET